MEIGNLPEKEFRKMIVKIIQDLRKRMEAKIEKMQKMYTTLLFGISFIITKYKINFYD